MNYLRSVDDLSHSLASVQARIFEKSVSNGIPSKLFIRSYMISKEADYFDDLNLDVAGLSEIEIYNSISKKIKTKKGELYPYPVMHFIGYFYRMAAYLTDCSSVQLYRNIKPELLFKNFQTLHSLSIEDAVKEVFDITHFELEDKYSLFKKIYRNI